MNGFSGDNGAAVSAAISGPAGMDFDSAGNLYFADSFNNRIRKIAAGGTITTVAGNGTAKFSGDNGASTSAGLNYPTGVAIDSAGNIFIANRNNRRVRKVDASGLITTVAGGGAGNGDGGPATSAQLSHPTSLAFDSAANLYMADAGYNSIRKMTVDGTISTIAGNGYAEFSAEYGPSRRISLNQPGGIAVDPAGFMYIADTNNQRVRVLNLDVVFTDGFGQAPGG